MKGVRSIGIIFATVAAAVAGTAALAQSQQQQPVSALKGHNSNAPVDVKIGRASCRERV